MKTKNLLAICIFSLLTVNLTYARWPSVDPHAENYYPQSPYAFCSNNPINRVDPDGKKDRRLQAGEMPGTQTRGSVVGMTTSYSVQRSANQISIIRSTNENYGNHSTNYTINGSRDNVANVSDKSATAISSSMAQTGERKISVTSTTRTPEKQAGIMYDNIQTQGVAAQRELYGANGNVVINTYEAAVANGSTQPQVVGAMTNTINEIGPQNVSRHCGDPAQINVIDIAPSSVINVRSFQNNLKINNDIQKVIPYPRDPAIHIEIRQ